MARVSILRFTVDMDQNKRTADIYRWTKKLGLVAIGVVYLIYLTISTDDNGYRFINENYYFAELWFTTGAISLGLLFVSIGDHLTTAPEGRSWRLYRSFMVSVALALFFFVFAFGVAIVDFAAGF